MSTDRDQRRQQVAKLAAQDQAVEALSAAVAVIVTDALRSLSSPRIRGPFPRPQAEDLTRPACLHELARWSRAAVLRSQRTLGSQGVADGLAAAERLRLAADLLASAQTGPGPRSAEAAAAALQRIEREGLLRLETVPLRGSKLLDLLGYLGEVVRAGQRPRNASISDP
jgi:hypothetical protein